MILLLFFFLGSLRSGEAIGITSVDDGSNDEILTTCKIADNVRSALHILNKMPEDNFVTDEDALTTLLRTELTADFPSLVTPAISSADKDLLFDLASMKGMLSNLDDLVDKNGAMDWANIDNAQALRIGFEQLALDVETDLDRQDYLSTWMVKLTTREVLTLSCGSQGSITNDNRKTSKNYLDGCYTGLTSFEVNSNGALGVYHCINACRDAKKKFSLFTTVDGCKCSNLGSSVASVVDTYDVECQTAQEKMLKTGLGEPIFKEEALLFDIDALGYPPVTNDDLISIEEVELDDGSSSIYIIALFKKVVSLFKESGNGLELVDWKRWDSVCDPDEHPELNDRCLHEVELEKRATHLPGFTNLYQKDALAFTAFKVMATLNHTMELDTDVDLSDREKFKEVEEDSSVKTGDPMVFPGGKMVDHVLISFTPKSNYRFALLRLENEKIIHLTEAVGNKFFGNFFPADEDEVEYPVTFTHRVIGRETYLFVGCHDAEEVDKGSVKLFKINEKQREITDFAAYGAIEMERVNDVTISTNFIGDMMYVQTIYPLLIVLDSPGPVLDEQPMGCRVRVYRIRKFTNLVEQDSIDITERFTSLDYISLDTGKFLILKSASRMIMLELSSKGILSRTLLDNYPSFSVADAVQFGRLQDDALISIRNSDSTNYEIYDILGNKIDETVIDLEHLDYQVMKCISRDTITCYAVRCTENQAHFEAFKPIQIYSKLNVAEDDITLTNWEASKNRIESMFSTLTPIYTGLVEKQTGYLMNSGSIVPSGGNWNIANLKASSFTAVSGVLDGTTVNMNIVDPTTGVATAVNYTPNDSSSGTDCRDALAIKLDDVTTKIGEVTTKTIEFDNTFNDLKLSLTSTNPQTITNAKVDLVNSITISSSDYITVDEFKATDGTTKSLSDIISKTFLQNDIKPLTGTKTFSKLIKIDNLETAELSDEGESKVTVSPADCFVKDRDTTITIAQTFNKQVNIGALKMEEDASIINTNGHSIVKEDLVPHSSRTDGLEGHFSFTDSVSAVGLNSHIDGFLLTSGDADNMALKNSANTIPFDLTVNIADAPGNKASGESILLEQGVLLNSVDLYNKKINAVRTSCEGCSSCNDNCGDSTVQIISPVTFQGTVTAPSMELTSVNSKEFDKFIDQTEFDNSQISITGIKTLTNVNANTLKASTFHELELDTLLTTNSVQEVTGEYTFNKVSEYASINTPTESPCVPVDGKDLCAIFKSDLEAVNQAESWIQSNSIDTDVKFSKLTIKAGAAIEFDNLVNGMILADVVGQIVTDENKAFTIEGEKTTLSSITLQSVSSNHDSEVNIISGDNTCTISDFVNTHTTTEIVGHKTFSNAVLFEDIFTVGSAHINDLDVSHMLHCFVDKNSDDVTDIHILHPVHYHTVSVPKLVVERDSVNFESYGTVPLDTSIETAALFVGLELDPVNKESLIQSMLSVHGLIVEDSDEVGKDVMLSFVIRDQENLLALSLLEKRNQLNLLLNTRHGITMTSLEALTDLEALQIIARNPKVNSFDPSTDLALLDSNNVFCTAEDNCIQNFNGGLAANSVQVSGELKILDDKLVHNVNPSVVDADRISLTRNNNIGASKKFTSLSMDQTDGVFTGSLNIETSDGFVSSSLYPDKFLSTTKPAENTQTIAGPLVMGAIKAQDITATQLKIDDGIYDISSIDSATYNVDEPLTFDNLDVQGAATIHDKITVVGSVEGVIIEDLHDLLVFGEDIVVDDSTTIAGTSRAQLELKGTKTLSSLTVDNLNPILQSGKVHPDFAYLPCTTSPQITGPLTGKILDTVESSVEGCSTMCRNRVDCYGISYLEAGSDSSQCRLYGSKVEVAEVADAGWEASVSFTFECCGTLKAIGSDFFLSVLDSGVITTSLNSDFWCFANEDKIVHKSTDKVITVEDGALVLSDVPRSSSQTATRTDETLTYELHENSEFKIQTSAGLWINKDNPSGSQVALDAPNSISILLQGEGTTKWKAFIGGVLMNEVVDGNLQSRLLLKSEAQTMSGTLIVQGGMTVEDATLITPTISTLSHDDVTAVYNWNDATSTHEVATAFEITGSGFAVTNLVSAAYDADLNDFIQLDTVAEDLKLQGTTTFTDLTITTSEITVDGTVAGQDISDMDTNLARNNVDSLVFTANNRFSENILTTTGLTSTVDMTLTKSQIQGGVDVVDLRDKTILNDDDTAAIKGTVNFNKIMVSGGALTMGKANLNGAGDIEVPSAFIQATDSSIDLTAHKVGTLTAQGATTINGQVCGRQGEEFLNVFYKNGDQTITADLTISGQIEVTGNNLATTTINGFTPENDLVFLDGEVSMDADTTFTETLSITNAVVNGNVDGFDFIAKFRDSVAVVDADNIISEKWTFTSASEFKGTVDGSSTTDDHYINEQRVSDMNAACHLHDNIYAVKVSAQAEASVLCDFVSDLQDSYLSGQEVVYYRQKSSKSFSGKKFQEAVMKTTADNDVYLFLLSSQGLEIHQIVDGDSQMVETQTIAVSNVNLPPKLQSVVDITEDDGFSYLIFVGSGVPGDTVQMIKFSGTSDGTRIITSMGVLSDATTVSEVNLHYIVVLKHILNADSTAVAEVSLEGYGCHLLKSCEENCDNVTPDVLLNPGDIPNLGIIPSSVTKLSQITMKSIQALNGYYVVAFNLDSSFGQKVVGIFVFEKTTEGAFNNIKTMIDSTSSCKFELAEFDAKLFMLSADPQFEMKEINIELETLFDRYLADDVNTKLQGQIFDIKVENEYGSGYGVSVLSNGDELINMKYWGIEGLHIINHIKLDNFYQSIGSTTAVVDSKFVYLRTLVDSDMITVLQGDLASQSTYVKFECAKPEIPAAWATAPVLD